MPRYQLADIGVTNLDTGQRITRADREAWAEYRQFLASGGEPAPMQSERGPTVTLAEAIANRLAEVRGECRTLIYQRWPAETQHSAALGVYPAALRDQIQTEIAQFVAASNAAENAIESALTADEALAVMPTWPVFTA